MFNFSQKGDSSPLDNNFFSGGDGSTEQNAVIIKATSSSTGVPAEYTFMQAKFGRRGIDWKLERQTLSENNSKRYDIMLIKLSNGSTKEIYFDITRFFGK